MFNKKLKEEIKKLQQELEETKIKLKETEIFLGFFKSSDKAKTLFDELKKENYISLKDKNRIKLLENTIDDINYRDYITKTKNGEICIDIHQIPLSDEEIKQLLK